MRLFFHRLHSCIGIATGLLVFVLCLTGALLVYKYELRDWMNPQLQSMPGEMTPGQALHLARLADPALAPTLLAFPSDAFSIGHFSVPAPDGQDGRQRLFLDARIGEAALGLQSDADTFLRLFHVQFLAGQPGRWFVGGLGLAMAVSLLSGLFIHRHLLRDFFKVRLRRSPRLALSDSHRAAGLWLFPLHLIIALTGAWLGLMSLLMPVGSAPGGTGGGDWPAPHVLERSLEAAKASLPGSVLTHVNVTHPDYLVFHADLPWQLVERGRTTVRVDRDRPSAERHYDPRQLGPAWRLHYMAKPLHFGDFGGQPIKAVYFTAGLAGALLALLGTLIWVDRRARLGGYREKGTPWTAMHRFTLGAAAGCAVALFLTMAVSAMAAGRFSRSENVLSFAGGMRLVPDLNADHGVWLFVGVWIVAGVAIAAASTASIAWQRALWGTSGALLMMPPAGAVASGSVLADWQRGGGLGLVVTLLAVCAAAVFIALAKRFAPPSQAIHCNKEKRA